jgi:recombinational DNA repair protein RecR
MHDTIRGQIGCHFCRNYTKPLNAKVCHDCIREHPGAKVFEMYKEIYIDDKSRKEEKRYLNLERYMKLK